MRNRVFLNWPAGTDFGWGVFGLNLFLHWANDDRVEPFMGAPIAREEFATVDPLRMLRASSAISVSNRWQAELAHRNESLRSRRMVLIDALGNRLQPPKDRMGVFNVARCIFEDTRLEPLDKPLTKYDVLLCASSWNEGMLRAHTSKPVWMIHEGIDESLFFPGPRSGLLDPSRFYVFSGGKVEYRKAQDLVLLAFREFATRHDDAVLVTAWHSRFKKPAQGLKGKLAHALGNDGQGGLDINGWVTRNGIGPTQFIDLGGIPNPLVPAVLREMDCALQPSRAEACTNLPAKEAMACGIPVIVAKNSGMVDLIAPNNCVPLTHQSSVETVDHGGTDGWGESDVEEIVASLELLYNDTARRKAIGLAGAKWVTENQRTWKRHAAQLGEAIAGAAPRAND